MAFCSSFEGSEGIIVRRVGGGGALRGCRLEGVARSVELRRNQAGNRKELGFLVEGEGFLAVKMDGEGGYSKD